VAEWAKTLEQWRTETDAAVKSGKELPEKPVFQGGKDRFFEDLSFRDGAFALPAKNPEAALPAESRKQYAELIAQQAQLKKLSAPEPPMATAVTEGDVVKQHVFIRGNHHSPGEPVERDVPRVLAPAGGHITGAGSGRLALARWLTDSNNPLTARVMVNRIWQWHFGSGLVKSASNFGTQGERPTHPELLDYLAARFIAGGWSVKSMHRIILQSNVYRQDANASAEAQEHDPENRWLSHFSRRRLTAEEIRDALLFISGDLDTAMGGSLLTGEGNDGSDDTLRPSLDPLTSNRRSIYMPLRRSNLPVYFNLFDFGDATTTLDRRTRTNVPSQSLFFMNSAFVDAKARRLANAVSKGAASASERIRRLGYRVLGRELDSSQVGELADYVAKFQTRRAEQDTPESAPQDAWASLIRVLYGSNSFVYVD
jgi:hypothetical protein